MAKIIELDPERRIARVQPGVILDDLRSAAEKHNLTFGPDPASHSRCTIGGIIGNNSCGVHSVMAGKTDQNIEELEILTYDGLRMPVGQTSNSLLESFVREGGRRGEIYSGLKTLRDQYGDLVRQIFPNIPRRVSGYNLLFFSLKTALMWHARWSARKEPASRCSKRPVVWSRARNGCRWSSPAAMFSSAPIFSPKCCRTIPSASKAWTT